MPEKSWRQAIIRVLQEATSPLHYMEITEQILSRDYYHTDGATPAATVNAQIAHSIKHDGQKSPFVRVAKGIFALRNSEQERTLPKQDKSDKTGAEEPETADSVVRAFGMYWQRDLVVWKNDPKLFGKQQMQSKAVDFGKQKGIYILYDHHTVLYVGRAIDRTLGKRLYEHTVDRLSGRWNRFSWFGLLEVSQEGDLRESALKASLSLLVSTMEAILIETLEPPQNRKRGDDLSGLEYIQDADPELREKEIQHTLRAIEQKLRGAS